MAPAITSNVWGMIRRLVKDNVLVISNAGAPSDGTTGTGAGKAGPGSLLVDITNKKLYQNTNTKASPTWQSLGDIAPSEITLAQGRVLVGDAGGLAAALNSSAGGNILVGNDTTMVALDASPDAQLVLGNGTTITSVAMSGDITIDNAGVTAIGATKVVLAMLATGIAPSHVVKFAGEFTTVGGDADESITVTGALATDLAFVVLKTPGSTPRTVLNAEAATDAIEVEFSGDPSTDHVVTYQVLRAAV
jgi:hypothetical protein